MSTALKGGCLCGAIRYQLDTAPHSAGYCHCRMCQRASGAPLVAWMTIANNQFRYTKGEPGVYHSSSRSQREFCPYCGTQLVFRTDGAERVDVTLSSLDNSDKVKPAYHIWHDSKPQWLHLGDLLPRYDNDGPDDL
ncbi:GFA family protein [Pokkaliibacter sp. CJK22405]|uniref:GFA family protein n=1 Tax=Pokkaliibacter sp. CJK22405 TaxID=3384615 RepID=UPI00398501EA